MRIFLVFLLVFSLFAKKSEESRLQSLLKLQMVLGIVEKYYVDDIKFQKIIDKSIKGLMEELDAHSSYLDEKAFTEMKISTKGEFGGLGIVVGLRNGVLTVISPIDNTPAFKAGIKSGDRIIKINDKSTLNMTLDEAVSIMRGKKGTPIDLTIFRKGKNKPIKIHIVRDIIKIQSVFAKNIENNPNILYIRIASFDKKVVKNLKKAIKNKKNLKGIILDLRNNPGGLLDQAIGVVDTFVDEGIIVSQRGRDKKDEEKHYATTSNTLTKVPMVVLVNGGSASASEIVSGSLQDHKRAVIVGEKTFGKGSVQVIIPLNKKKTEAIKITIARYYLPSGRTIQAKGVEPDVVVAESEVPKAKEDEFKIKEAELKRHLKAELNKIDHKKAKKEKKIDKKKFITKDDIYNDNQLKEAIDILKALILIQRI